MRSAWQAPDRRRCRDGLKAALDDLRSIAPPDRVEVVDEQLELLAAATERAMDDEHDVELALHPDREGIGAAVAADR